MKAERRGQELIDQEGALDQQFASRSITPEALKDATVKIGVTQADCRTRISKYHLRNGANSLADQMKQYADLRGYNSDAPARHHRAH